jgi:hypothetical protein
MQKSDYWSEFQAARMQGKDHEALSIALKSRAGPVRQAMLAIAYTDLSRAADARDALSHIPETPEWTNYKDYLLGEIAVLERDSQGLKETINRLKADSGYHEHVIILLSAWMYRTKDAGYMNESIELALETDIGPSRWAFLLEALQSVAIANHERIPSSELLDAVERRIPNELGNENSIEYVAVLIYGFCFDRADEILRRIPRDHLLKSGKALALLGLKALTHGFRWQSKELFRKAKKFPKDRAFVDFVLRIRDGAIKQWPYLEGESP